MAAGIEIRTELRPGDVGEVARLHGLVYAREYGLDVTFEAEVAEGLGQAVVRGFPSEGERAFIAESDGRFAGALFLTNEGAGLGRVRWFLLDPAERGRGLGRRMLGELMAAARAHGYERLELFTFAALEAAAHLYRDAGFRCVGSTEGARWGRELTWQRYEARISPSSSTTAAASSEGSTSTPSPGP